MYYFKLVFIEILPVQADAAYFTTELMEYLNKDVYAEEKEKRHILYINGCLRNKHWIFEQHDSYISM